jgi:anti-sigma factor RsiW
MECLSVRETLSEYIDGSLPEAQSLQLAGHLTECDGCQSLELQLSEIRSAARDLPLHTPSKALWTRISNVIEAEGLINDPRATMPMKKETFLDRLRHAWASLSGPQLVGAGALATVLIMFGAVGVYQQLSPADRNGISTAMLAEESQLKAEFELKLSALKAKMTGWNTQQRSAFEGDLQRIEKSIESCRQQMQAHPHDAQYVEQMRKLYAEKTALLEQAAQAK